MKLVDLIVRNFKVKAIRVRGAAAETTLVCRPDPGKVWLIMDAWGYHNDTTSRASYWGWESGVPTTISKQGVDLAAMIGVPLKSVGGGQDMESGFWPYIITEDVYLKFIIPSLGAGKVGTACLFVLEYNLNER